MSDCKAGEDEANCPLSLPSRCGKQEFQCGDGSCVPAAFVCDGNMVSSCNILYRATVRSQDCLDGWDERGGNCSSHCTSKERACSPGGKCIPAQVHRVYWNAVGCLQISEITEIPEITEITEIPETITEICSELCSSGVTGTRTARMGVTRPGVQARPSAAPPPAGGVTTPAAAWGWPSSVTGLVTARMGVTRAGSAGSGSATPPGPPPAVTTATTPQPVTPAAVLLASGWGRTRRPAPTCTPARTGAPARSSALPSLKQNTRQLSRPG